jgi:hypothetical protein
MTPVNGHLPTYTFSVYNYILHSSCEKLSESTYLLFDLISCHNWRCNIYLQKKSTAKQCFFSTLFFIIRLLFSTKFHLYLLKKLSDSLQMENPILNFVWNIKLSCFHCVYLLTVAKSGQITLNSLLTFILNVLLVSSK